jgi:hypothetical protein
MGEHMPMMSKEEFDPEKTQIFYTPEMVKRRTLAQTKAERDSANYEFSVGEKIYLRPLKTEGEIEEGGVGELELGENDAWEIKSIEGNPGEETMVYVVRDRMIDEVHGMGKVREVAERYLKGEELFLARNTARRLSKQSQREPDAGKES